MSRQIAYGDPNPCSAVTPFATSMALALSFAGSAAAQELPLSLCAPQSNTFSTRTEAETRNPMPGTSDSSTMARCSC
jgi:hypothetical protein